MAVLRWYAVDIRKLTFAELWRVSPGAGFLVAAFHKALGLPLALGTKVPEIDALDLLGPGAVPEDAARLMAPHVGEWESLGFARAFDYTIPPVSAGMRSFASVLLGADGGTFAEVVFVEKVAGPIRRRELADWCLSCYENGRRVGVTSLRRRMNGPRQFEMAYLTGRPPADLCRMHERLKAGAGYGPPIALDAGTAQRLIVENNNLSVAFMVGRGVYVEPRESAPSPIVPG